MRENRLRGWVLVAVLAALAGACDSDSGTETVALQVQLSASPGSIAVDGESTITTQLMANGRSAGPAGPWR